MVEEIKNPKTLTVHQRFSFIYKPMLSYCLKCRKNLENKNPKVARTNKAKLMLFSRCTLYNSKKIKIYQRLVDY